MDTFKQAEGFGLWFADNLVNCDSNITLRPFLDDNPLFEGS